MGEGYECYDQVESGEKGKVPKMVFFSVFFIRNNLSRVDLIIKVVLEFPTPK